MKTLLLYARIALFMVGVLVGLQFPMFVDQYGKSLTSHYIESSNSISGFQQDANKFFAGDLPKMISYYKENGDPVFYDGGESIEAIYHRFLALESALQRFQSGSWNAYRQAFFNPVKDIKKEVWENYDFATKLTPSAITLGLASGLSMSVILEFGLKLVSLLAGLLIGRQRRYE